MLHPTPPSLSPETADHEAESGPLQSRVCDRCIRKKVKCNQARPTCSRCFEGGETCSYTSVKRKPGPPRGSHYTPRAPKSPARPDENDTTEVLEHVLSTGDSFPNSVDTVVHDSVPVQFSGTPHHGTGSSPSFSSSPDFSPRQEEYLLESYFDIIQDANPIYSRERFLHRYRSSLCSPDLISAMVVITAKLTGFPRTEDGSSLDSRLDIDSRLDSILNSGILEDDLIGDAPSLDQFRKAYLLAFYEFHQFPGHHSWLRIGRVTRMAYRIGLDRLDRLRVLYSDWSTLSNEDIQEWRWLWLCLYRLDTYSNLSAGTPYLIDEAAINTSFYANQTQHHPDINDSHSHQNIFLPPTLDSLSKLIPAVASDQHTLLNRVHNMTIATLRQTGLVLRMYMTRWQEELTTQVANSERQLATLRLALPPGWLNPRRNVFSNESPLDHHARLITVFHLRMTQLLLSLSDCSQRQENDWLIGWQRVLEACQDIALLADQWDSAFCVAVDPAISFTIFTALIFLDLHRKSSAAFEQDLRSNIDHDITVLHLQLKHFGGIWTLPKLLTLSFEGFCESVSGPLSYQHITLILSRFEAPLHPKWLHFLSSAQSALEAVNSTLDFST